MVFALRLFHRYTRRNYAVPAPYSEEDSLSIHKGPFEGIRRGRRGNGAGAEGGRAVADQTDAADRRRRTDHFDVRSGH